MLAHADRVFLTHIPVPTPKGWLGFAYSSCIRPMPSVNQPHTASAAAVRHTLDALRNEGRIRIDAEEAAAIAYALDGLYANAIDLFGSRTDPDKRGGDIDILIRTSAPAYETSQRVAVRFFSRCEEKIDVVVLSEDLTPAQQDFLQRLNRVPVL